jgi:hypothetical protein
MKAIIFFAVIALAAQASFDPVQFYKGLTGTFYKDTNEVYHSIECVKTLAAAENEILDLIATLDFKNSQVALFQAASFLSQYEECRTAIVQIQEYVLHKMQNASHIESNFAAHYPEFFQLIGISIGKIHYEGDSYLAGKLISDAVNILFEGSSNEIFTRYPDRFVPFNSEKFLPEFVAGAISSIVFNNNTLSLGITECFKEVTEQVAIDFHHKSTQDMTNEERIVALYEFYGLLSQCVEVHHLDLHVFNYLVQPAHDHISETAFKVIYRTLVNLPYLDKSLKVGAASLVQGEYVDTGRAFGKVIRYLLGGI